MSSGGFVSDATDEGHALDDRGDQLSRVARRTEHFDAAVQDTMHAVDDTARRVRGTVEWRLMRLAKLTYGVTSAMRGLFSGRCSGETPGQVR